MAQLEVRGEHVTSISPPIFSLSLSTMSKRGDPTPIRTAKVKKRKGVGSRTIIVPDSDEEGPTPNEYAQVTKTRVATSGKAEKVTMTSVPIFEAKQSITQVPQEEDAVNPADVTVENVAPAVTAKRRRRANDSVRIDALCSCTLLKALQTKMWTWLNVHDSVLDEMVRLDGLGDNQPDLCSSCSNDKPTLLYRCLECSSSLLHCRECIVNLHRILPLHRLEVCLFSSV